MPAASQAALYRIGGTFVWHCQIKQGWFHFSKGWQSKGLGRQNPLLPHSFEEKSEPQEESMSTTWG